MYGKLLGKLMAINMYTTLITECKMEPGMVLVMVEIAAASTSTVQFSSNVLARLTTASSLAEIVKNVAVVLRREGGF